MATFDFPYHRVSTAYPESSIRIQLGNSWTFTAAPDAPDQRIFTLSFQGMQYFLNSSGEIRKTFPAGDERGKRNMARLEDFYIEHKLWKSFDYPHPVYGTIVVKFQNPLQIPEGIAGGNGVLEPFQIKLIEQP